MSSPTDRDQLLLVIDQFEELFTQVDEETANRFIDELVELVTAPRSRTRVVVTLRADFYDRPLRHRGLGELLRDGTEVITPMSIDELEAAITGPAAKVGVNVDAARRRRDGGRDRRPPGRAAAACSTR